MSGTVRLKPLAFSVLIPLVGGFLSSRISGDMQAVYASLRLPDFAPPAWVFGVVWPVLYLLMGIAAYLIWEMGESDDRTQALTFYAMQLGLNLLWSPVFFRIQNYGVAFWLLSCVLVLAVLTAGMFGNLRRSAFWLLTPYLAWLVYAAALGRSIAALNQL